MKEDTMTDHPFKWNINGFRNADDMSEFASTLTGQCASEGFNAALMNYDWPTLTLTVFRREQDPKRFDRAYERTARIEGGTP